jgi:hypothetical protein
VAAVAQLNAAQSCALLLAEALPILSKIFTGALNAERSEASHSVHIASRQILRSSAFGGLTQNFIGE